VVKSGCDRRLDEAAAALRSGGRQVRLVALSQSGEWERERMGGPARRVEEEEGGPGSRQGARPVEAGGVGRARAGVSVLGKTGEEEKPLTGGARVLCWRFKSNQTDPKQFK
jgi:hypothetical protein